MDSLSFRLGLTVTVGILATAMFVAAGVVWRTVEREASDRGLEIEVTARALSASVSDAVADQQASGVYEGLRALQYTPSVSFAAVKDINGVRLAQVGHQAVLVDGQWRDSIHARLDRLLRPKTLSKTMEIRHAGRVVGTLTLAGEAPGLRPALAKEFKSIAWWALFAILSGIMVAYRQQRRIIRPLKALTEVIASPSQQGNLPAKATVAGVGEVGVLVGRYNEMIGQITKRDQIIADHNEHLERKVGQRTSELRVARDRAEEATEAKSRFLATMSHEIRTPMNGVLVMAELLERSALGTEQKNYANVIAKSGRSLLTLLNDVLDFSKMDAGRVTLELLPVSIDDLVEEVASLFWEQARSKNVALVTFVAPDVPEKLSGDPTRLRQCLSNLIGNALKFTESGHVAVDVTCSAPNTLRISVSDTGSGIPQNRQAAIFEAFEQSSQSTTRTHGGTGLGLAIVSRLVNAMDGEVTVNSTVGEGSRFTIAIPVDTIASAPHIRPSVKACIALEEAMEPALRQRLAASLSAMGADITQGAERADCLISSVETAHTHGDAVPIVGLWPFGAREPRAALEEGTLRDVFQIPFTRADAQAFAERVSVGNFRGADALTTASGDPGTDSSRFAHVRVLVADDDEVNRQVITDALGAFGIVPTVVEDGAQAVDAATRDIFDVILLDGMMPVMGGREAAQILRREGSDIASHDAEIVFFSATTSSVQGEEDTDDLFDHRLPKPFALDDLERLLLSLRVVENAPVIAPTKKQDVPSEKSTIDSTVFDTLRNLDARRPGAMKRIIDRLFETLPQKIDDLETALASGNPEDVRRAAHSLKSVSGSAGGRALAELAADIEMKAIEYTKADRRFAPDEMSAEHAKRVATQTMADIDDLLVFEK